MRIGDRVVMTPLGAALAKERKLAVRAGMIREHFRAGRRSHQILVRRDDAGVEWWPIKAWSREGER